MLKNEKDKLSCIIFLEIKLKEPSRIPKKFRNFNLKKEKTTRIEIYGCLLWSNAKVIRWRPNMCGNKPYRADSADLICVNPLKETSSAKDTVP